MTNNTVSEGAVNNRKSRDPLVNREWKIIQRDLLAHNSAIEAKRVKSADNAAAALSRGLDSSKKVETRESNNNVLTLETCEANNVQYNP